MFLIFVNNISVKDEPNRIDVQQMRKRCIHYQSFFDYRLSIFLNNIELVINIKTIKCVNSPCIPVWQIYNIHSIKFNYIPEELGRGEIRYGKNFS